MVSPLPAVARGDGVALLPRTRVMGVLRVFSVYDVSVRFPPYAPRQKADKHHISHTQVVKATY